MSNHKIELSVESRRPALVSLANDIEGLVDELMQGFDNRRQLVEWLQKSIAFCLGEIPIRFYRKIAAEMHTESIAIQALVDTRADAMRIRAGIIERWIIPGQKRAMRQLRSDATEYVSDSESARKSDIDPFEQQYIAMRPAINEIHQHQQQAVDALMQGFDNRRQLVEWIPILELATNTEVEQQFLSRLFETSTQNILLSDNRKAKIQFICYHLLPYFVRGMRDVRNRSKEEPNTGKSDMNIAQI